MQQRFLGGSGLRVSRLGLGLWGWGTDVDEHEAADELRAFVNAGGTLVDTAVNYGRGASEAMLGTLLRGRFKRDDLVIATKAGVRQHAGKIVYDTSRRAMIHGLETSLRTIGVDHVDLWQVHVSCDDVPLEETLAALDTAVATGRAHYAGISNFPGWRTAQAATHQRGAPGRTPLASTQMEYSLLQRGIEREVLPAARALGLGILVWSPLGRGVLTGKYRAGTPTDSRGASGRLSGFVSPYLSAEANRVVDAVCKAADGLSLTPAQVALSWVRDRPGVTAPIVGARTATQLAASLEVEKVSLPTEIREALDDVSAPELGYPDG